MTDNIKVNGVCLKQSKIIYNDELVKVIKLDNIGKGYAILANDTEPRKGLSGITFHTGNPLDGINGVSIESLLAICKDRLETFNAQGFTCMENNIAIECCSAAIESLQTRSRRIVSEKLKAAEEQSQRIFSSALNAKHGGGYGKVELEEEGIVKLMSEGEVGEAPEGAVYKRD